MFKKLICIALSAAMLMSLYIFNAGALTSGVFGYRITDDGAEITSYVGSSDTVIIPDTIIGCPVSSIGEDAFRKNPIKAVTIPSGVKNIKAGAFAECETLEKAEFPDTLEEIGDTAFYGCENLSSDLTFCETLKTIGDSAFENCWNMTYAVLPKSLENIGYCAFGYYFELEDKPDAYENETLKYYDYRRGDFRIFGYPETAAQSYCEKQDVKFCDRSKGETAFTSNEMDFYVNEKGEAELGSYFGTSQAPVIPAKANGYPVKYIGRLAFFGADIRSVTIPDSVIEIGEWAFENCPKMGVVKLPPSVEVINQGAFGYCNENGVDFKYDDFVLRGAKNSTAQAYAREYNFEFEDVYTTSITLSKTKGTVYLTGTLKIKSSVKNPFGKTTYKSSDSKTAKVDSSGKVTGKKAGKAKITVQNNGVKKTFTVTVKNPSLNKTNTTAKLGKIYQLKIKGKVGKAEFFSGNSSILKVNPKTGKYKGLRAGKTKITVKTNGIKLSCKVRVN